MEIENLRRKYHSLLNEHVIRVRKIDQYDCPNFADIDNHSSKAISSNLFQQMHLQPNFGQLKEQSVGSLFEKITRDFIEEVFNLLQHLRPGKWLYSVGANSIDRFSQYEHLSTIKRLIEGNKELVSILGKEYIIKPDIVIGRMPVSDEEINLHHSLVSSEENIASLTSLRESNQHGAAKPILHASISCKWTIRSDRSQNTRTEALNLIRNRKGKLPHVVAVTAEPLPSRIATLALGTGDLDCVYHFALNELISTVNELNNEDQKEMLDNLVIGKRLRDVSDLPFDISV